MKLQRLFGLLYMLAGVAKAFPSIEDVNEVLYKASIANQNTVYGELSIWLSEQSEWMTVFVAIVLFISGLVLFVNKGPIKSVIYAQLVMLVGFMVLLHNSHPQVILLDSIFIIAAILMLREHNKVRCVDPSNLSSKDYENRIQSEMIELDQFNDEYDVVVVGGGVSGLTAAFELQDKNILCLEKSSVFGGNARYCEQDGLKHPTAGVCFQCPVPGSGIDVLLEKLGLKNKWKDTTKDTIVFFDTRLLMSCIGEVSIAMLRHPSALVKPATWKLALILIFNWVTGKRFVVAPRPLGDPIFADLYDFLDQFAPENGKFPSMPWGEECGWSRTEMECLDEISLYSYLFEPEKLGHIPAHLKPRKSFGKLVESAVDMTLRIECLAVRDVSAYVGLHFLLGYLRGVLVTLPGGTGGISHAIFANLEKKSNIDFATRINVNSIAINDDYSCVEFTQGSNNYIVRAKSIIWAAPKHAIGDIINELPEKQLTAISEIAHYDYCLANVYLDRSVMSQFFGGYVIEPYNKGNQLEWCKVGVTLVPHWMDDNYDEDFGILSMLKPIPLKEDQGKLSEVTFENIQSQAYQEIVELLSALKIDRKHVQDIKLWSWEKGIIVSSKGQIKNDLFRVASKQHRNIFFANHDSIGLGNIESAIGAGVSAGNHVRTYLKDIEDIISITP